jgi:phosphohistidine phosphatase
MKQTLMLLRHAKAVPWGYEVNDFGRVLAGRGRRHAQALSRWAAANVQPPEMVLCSSSARTVETLEPFITAWPELAGCTHYLDDLYHASAGSLHHQASKALAECNSLLMVGHNPGFESLVLNLLDREAGHGINNMATGTLAVLGFPAGFAAGEAAQLLHWVTRHDLSVE